MFPNKAPASATPTGGGGWSGWSPSTSSSRPATLGYPAVNTPFKGPVPQVPISRPTNTFNPPGQPTPTAPAPKPPATPKPATPTASPGIASGAGLTALAYGVPKALQGDFGGAVIDAAVGGVGYAAAAAGTTALLAAAGISAPAWAPVAAGIVGAAALSAIGNSIWGDKGGDGSEGVQTTVSPGVIGVPGVPGKTSNYYRIDVIFSPFPVPPYSGMPTTSNVVWSIKGPVSATIVSAFYLGAPRWRMIVTDSNGTVSSHDLYGVSAPGGGDWWADVSANIVRTDGTPIEDDIAQGSIPGTPSATPTAVTQNITNGDTIININPAPQLGSPKTPTLPQPVSPPKQKKPTTKPKLQTGNPPTARPATATPSAPTTKAGTPTGNIPETGPAGTTKPAPAPNVTSIKGDLQPAPAPATKTPNPGLAAAVTSPGLAVLTSIAGVPNQTKTPTPTTAPQVIPSATNSTDTGPNPAPVSQTGEELRGRKVVIKNEKGEIIGSVTEYYDKNNNLVKTVVNSSVNIPTANTVQNQIEGQTQKTNQDLNDWQEKITETISSDPTNATTLPQPSITENITNTVNNSTNTITENITNTVNNSTNTITENVTNTVNNSTNTITENITNTVNNSTNTITENITNTVNNSTTTIIEEISGVELGTDQIKADTVETLAIVGTLATAAALNAQTATITDAIANQPSPCTYPSYHPENVAERAAISGKVDGVNTVLGTVTNVQIAQANTGISSIISAIGTPIAGGAQTLFAGIQAIQTWGTNFAKSIHLDRAINALSFMLQVHNAAMLSRNLAESVGQLIDSTLTALRLKDEDDEFLDIPTMIGNSVQGLLTSILGAETYQGINRQWKLLSAIYTSAMNIYGAMLSSLSGIAEGVQVAGNYTGRIGNALKRGGVVLENAYNWMDDNLRIKMGKVAWLDSFANNLETVTDAVEDVTQVPEEVISVGDNYKDAKEQLQDVKQLIADNVTAKTTAEDTDKAASDPGTIADGSVPPFTL